jgi:hypothetical protein
LERQEKRKGRVMRTMKNTVRDDVQKKERKKKEKGSERIIKKYRRWRWEWGEFGEQKKGIMKKTKRKDEERRGVTINLDPVKGTYRRKKRKPNA